jgi:class 3 adenylate cyclase
MHVLLTISPLSPVVLPALQAAEAVTRHKRAAARLAKRDAGPQLIKVFAQHRASREDAVVALLYAVLADVAVHDPGIGESFAARGWAPLLVEFLRRKMRAVKLAVPATRALTHMVGDERASVETAEAFGAAGVFAVAARLLDVYSGQLRHSAVLKQALRLVSGLLLHEGAPAVHVPMPPP